MCTSASFAWVVTNMAGEEKPYKISPGASDFIMDNLMKMASIMHQRAICGRNVRMLQHEEIVDTVGVPYPLQISNLNGHCLSEVDEGFPDTLHLKDIYSYLEKLTSSSKETRVSGCLITANKHTIAVVCMREDSNFTHVLFDPLPALVALTYTKVEFEEMIAQALGVVSEFSLTAFQHTPEVIDMTLTV